MKVELIGHTPDPELLPSLAAKLTHSSVTLDKLKEISNKEDLKKLLKKVMEMGHSSVVEHSSFTFAISGVSRALTHQLVRHRIASYSQQSQRYVKLEKPNYVTPPSISKDREMKEKYDELMEEIWDFYESLKDFPIEDARYVLPNATHSNILVTMNARSLLNFFELRCCLHAQWEIRQLAWKMLELAKEVALVLFEKAGPPCKTRGECPLKKEDCRWYPKIG